jgi:hypothetical protein
VWSLSSPRTKEFSKLAPLSARSPGQANQGTVDVWPRLGFVVSRLRQVRGRDAGVSQQSHGLEWRVPVANHARDVF